MKVLEGNKDKFRLRLKGKAVVFIDWANVYGWKKSLKEEVDFKRLYKYLKSYEDIKEINLYHGTDQNKHSIEFLRTARNIGYNIITKPVKYIVVAKIKNKKIYRRKCDFDMEIALDCFEYLDKYDSYIFLSGDGDFATLYERLIKQKKQVIVVYAPGHIGKEVWQIKRCLFKVNIENIGL